MCEECRHNPHLPGCPNAPESEPKCYCYLCNDPIYVGDEYYVGALCSPICESCIMAMSAYELIAVNGEKFEIMEDDYE